MGCAHTVIKSESGFVLRSLLRLSLRTYPDSNRGPSLRRAQ